MPPIDYEALAPTRDYLQDICKVVGKYQQLFLEPEPHDWHRGLRLSRLGLATPKLRYLGRDVSLVLDLSKAQLKAANTSWQLTTQKPEAIRQELTKWLITQGMNKEVEAPEYGDLGAFNVVQSQVLSALLSSVWPLLTNLKQTIDPANQHTGPVLLFPHHFDISFVWYKNPTSVSNIDADNDKQLGFGFSTGDHTIAEPYFYITAYPKPEAFTNLVLESGARWQADGFIGAVLPYRVLIQKQDAANIFLRFATEVFKHSSQLL